MDLKIKMKELTIELTGICALDCIHCSHDRNEEAEIDHPGFEDGEIDDILDSHSGFEKVRISGGEPFNDAILWTILEEAKQRKLFTEILTSGVYSLDEARRPQPIPEQLIARCPGLADTIGFSIYGSRETHDFVTQTPGAFNALDKSVTSARKYRIPFSFNFVALRSSVPGLEEALTYAGYQSHMMGHNVPFRILRFIKQGDGADHYQQALSQSAVEELRERVPYLEKKYGLEISLGCSFAEKGCRAGCGKKVVSANGGYFDCSALKWHEGEVKPGSFPCRERW